MACEIPDFGRCCFCLPLRRGIVTFGYINCVWSAMMILMLAHYNPFFEFASFYSNVALSMSWEASVAVYCFDVIFSVLLIFGAHLKNLILLKSFLYYALTALMTLFIVKCLQISLNEYLHMEILSFGCFIISTCIHLYILMMVRSLIKKIETAPPEDGYQNQLNYFVNNDVVADVKAESFNSNTVMPTE